MLMSYIEQNIYTHIHTYIYSYILIIPYTQPLLHALHTFSIDLGKCYKEMTKQYCSKVAARQVFPGSITSSSTAAAAGEREREGGGEEPEAGYFGL